MSSVAGWEPTTVKLKVVWIGTPAGPKGVCDTLALDSSWTWAGPAADPSVAIALTIPFASEVDTTPLKETNCEFNDCQTTGTFGTGLPAPSRTCARSGAGNLAPGAPD